MKDIPANNGKDVKSFDIHEINTIDGVHQYVKPFNFKGKNHNSYEPKRYNRWVIKFEGAYKDIPQWALKKTNRPKLVNGNWTNFKITLRDAIGPSTAQALLEGFRYEWQVKLRKIPMIKYSLEMLGPVGDTIEKWEIEGKVINADFGKLNYEKDKLAEIKLEIKPSKVILVY